MQAERIANWLAHEHNAIDALKEFTDTIKRTFSLLQMKEQHPSVFEDLKMKLDNFISIQSDCMRELKPIFKALEDVEETITSVHSK